MKPILAAEEGRPVIVIGPTHLVRGILALRRAQGDVFLFNDMDAFDRWRVLHEETPLAHVVNGALGELGISRESLSPQLREAIDQLARARRVPHTDVFAGRDSAKRCFYRLWGAEFPESPARFLDRVRLDHVRRLLQEGLSRKEAAPIAGYSSVEQLRRKLNAEKVERTPKGS